MESLSSLYRSRSIAAIGVCIYIASLALPLNYRWDIPLFLLGLITLLTVLSVSENRSVTSLPIFPSVVLFLVATGVSMATSEDVERSIRLSAILLPAVLLFFLIAGHFVSTKDIHRLYFTTALVGLLLASALLWTAFDNTALNPFGWISKVGSPLLIVKNDVTLLAVICPLSLSLLYLKPQSKVGVISGFTILLSVVIVGIFQSRVAMLTMIVSCTCFFLLVRPKLALICASAIILLIVFLDGLMGFSIIKRFIIYWDGTGRIPLWLSAWKMFLHAPLLGCGPHTFVLFYKSYVNQLSLPSWLYVDLRDIPWAHNLYLEILAEQGIVGLGTFVLLFISGVLALRKIGQASSNEIRILSYGAFAGLLGFFFAALIELTFLRQWVVIMLFVLLGVIAQLTVLQRKEELSYYKTGLN